MACELPRHYAFFQRFIPMLAAAQAKIASPFAAHTFGALGKASAGSDLVWYGVHAVEMLVALMSALRDFVVDGTIPVPLEEAREIMGILEAGAQSEAGGEAIAVTV